MRKRLCKRGMTGKLGLDQINFNKTDYRLMSLEGEKNDVIFESTKKHVIYQTQLRKVKVEIIQYFIKSYHDEYGWPKTDITVDTNDRHKIIEEYLVKTRNTKFEYYFKFLVNVEDALFRHDSNGLYEVVRMMKEYDKGIDNNPMFFIDNRGNNIWLSYEQLLSAHLEFRNIYGSSFYPEVFANYLPLYSYKELIQMINNYLISRETNDEKVVVIDLIIKILFDIINNKENLLINESGLISSWVMKNGELTHHNTNVKKYQTWLFEKKHLLSLKIKLSITYQEAITLFEYPLFEESLLKIENLKGFLYENFEFKKISKGRIPIYDPRYKLMFPKKTKSNIIYKIFYFLKQNKFIKSTDTEFTKWISKLFEGAKGFSEDSVRSYLFRKERPQNNVEDLLKPYKIIIEKLYPPKIK